MNSGIYNLIIKLNKTASVTIGKLGRFTFPRGYYIYTGSAKKNLSQRIDRHKRKNGKKLKWHIDYLLNTGHAQIEDVLIYRNPALTECALNKKIYALNNSEIIVNNFGSSDCRNKCPAHLIFFREQYFNPDSIHALHG